MGVANEFLQKGEKIFFISPPLLKGLKNGGSICATPVRALATNNDPCYPVDK